ncbi:MAG: ABC transporter permease [Limnochordales bacterium]
MWGFLVRRGLYNVFVLLGVSFLTFALVFLTGDPAAALLPLGTPPEQIDSFRRQMGFDRPLLVQYAEFLWKAVQGDFGVSLRSRDNALTMVLERVPATLKLAGAGMLAAVLVSMPLGILAAARRGSWIDHLARLVALLGQTIPGFWLAIVLIYIFSVRLQWFPISGSAGRRHLVLPAVGIASTPAAGMTRLLLAGLVEVMSRDYVRTAYAKGLAKPVVVARHALRNALIPFITMMALQVGYLLGGAVVAEVVFAYPGMGRLAVQAITNRDLPVIQAFVMVTAVLIVTVNLLLDIVYTMIDPRIRYE